jgi:beta-lactamase superfamily II metal-dependent hydrolase
MLALRNIRYRPHRGFRSSTWYDLPLSFWQDANVEFVQRADSTVIAAELVVGGRPLDVTGLRTDPLYTTPPRNVSPQYRNFGAPTKLVVWNCGQGNFNEVQFESSRLLYDAGADIRWGRKQVRALLSRASLSKTSPSFLILSHWDADHYLSILSMTAAELSALSAVVAPAPIPRTATVQRTLQALLGAGIQVVGVPPSPRPNGTGRKIVLVRLQNLGAVTLYRATPGASSNQTGIVVAVEGRVQTAILPGDHHYPKLAPLVASARGIALVVPHHGGRAGALNPAAWRSKGAFDAMLSFGKGNQYGHPLPATTQFLRQCGANAQDTVTVGDIELVL